MTQSEQFHSLSQFTVEIGARGRLVLPAQVRRYLGIEEGDELILTVDDARMIRLCSRKHLASKLRGIYKDLSSKRSMVDELIADRRQEGESE